MTVEDQCWMASITKVFAGTAMMMAMDQGLLNPEDHVSKFLPTFHDADVTTPLTLRHVYLHTAGLWDQYWLSDENHELEQVLGRFYPYLLVGKRFDYTGTGYALGSKVLELLSGEALPLFYKHHLLDPLGMTNTEVAGSSGNAYSTAQDMAKLGQMLLNRGAYGHLRFLSEKAVEHMWPVKLAETFGTDVGRDYWGFGTMHFDDPGLGPGAFGHGAASSTIFCIDPEHDLVIVMARNDAGSNYDKYRPLFFKAIADSLAK